MFLDSGHLVLRISSLKSRIPLTVPSFIHSLIEDRVVKLEMLRCARAQKLFMSRLTSRFLL